MSSIAYFDRVAGQWEKMRRDFFPEALREKTLALAGVQAGQSAADIGAGSGFMTEGLLARGLKVTAVDQSENMLQVLAGKFGGNPNLDVRRGESEQLPLDTASVDYVFANMYLHHVERPAIAIKEMARILRPGGRLLVTDVDAHDFAFLKTEHHDRWMGFQRSEVSAWLSEAELGGVEVVCANQECCATSCCGSGDSARISIFMAAGVKP